MQFGDPEEEHRFDAPVPAVDLRQLTASYAAD
jgi:hypothetical protein